MHRSRICRAGSLSLGTFSPGPVISHVIRLPMYNIDSHFIAKLETEGWDLWTISLWKQWLTLLPQVSAAIEELRDSFHGVELGDGVGLHEANGIDDYLGEPELAKLRLLDERNDWQNIEPNQLNSFSSAPSFFDPKGFHFHLPAYLIAELTDQHDFDFISHVIEKRPSEGTWIGLLTPKQAKALISILLLVKQHPEYFHEKNKFEDAIQRFSLISA